MSQRHRQACASSVRAFSHHGSHVPVLRCPVRTNYQASLHRSVGVFGRAASYYSTSSYSLRGSTAVPDHVSATKRDPRTRPGAHMITQLIGRRSTGACWDRTAGMGTGAPVRGGPLAYKRTPPSMRWALSSARRLGLSGVPCGRPERVTQAPRSLRPRTRHATRSSLTVHTIERLSSVDYTVSTRTLTSHFTQHGARTTVLQLKGGTAGTAAVLLFL